MVLISAIFCLAAEENITFTTYYPAPKGSYKLLQLYPLTTAPSTALTCEEQTEGTLAYQKSDHTLYVCTFNTTSIPQKYEWASVKGN